MIPLVDLQAQYASIKDEIDTAVLRVLASGRFSLGPDVAAFEEEFATYCGADHGIAVNSGTSALHLALLAAGVGSGDEVITVPFTFIASVAAIRYTGATPVFVDIDPLAYTIDIHRLTDAITPRTKAIVPVHLYGQPADMDPLLTLARHHDLTVIEDAAQAHGAEYRGRRVGGLGTLGCFSFYPGKNLGAYGEGGIVVTNDETHARTIRSLRSWGEERRYHHTQPGFNYRMDGIQGAILRVKLRHLPAWTDARRRLAATYDRVLADTGVTTPTVPPDVRHVYHLYAVQTPHRDTLHQALDAEGIQTGLHYPVPVHLQPAYADLGGQVGDHPCAEAAATATLTLPVYPEMPEEVPARIAEVIRRTLATKLA
ncbi:MAG: DegT/DnrJ/EryC1/StrS family aminotransferase [Acidobacteria bacterium]|nr:DegT/DnrJ/EryC1/StrS family aminotransferase [Acidobacteriota bacterium]